MEKCGTNAASWPPLRGVGELASWQVRIGHLRFPPISQKREMDGAPGVLESQQVSKSANDSLE